MNWTLIYIYMDVEITKKPEEKREEAESEGQGLAKRTCMWIKCYLLVQMKNKRKARFIGAGGLGDTVR